MARPYGSRDAQEREYVPPVADTKRQGLVRLSPLVPPDVHAKAHNLAKAAGVSMGRYLAELIARDHAQADESTGAPAWAREAFGQATGHGQGELPMTG
jgi:hypothetical protein